MDSTYIVYGDCETDLVYVAYKVHEYAELYPGEYMVKCQVIGDEKPSPRGTASMSVEGLRKLARIIFIERSPARANRKVVFMVSPTGKVIKR